MSLLPSSTMPLQRRLTKMYTDTKSSLAFVSAPSTTAEDAEIATLHRKLRIQKDRLVSWGLSWSHSTTLPAGSSKSAPERDNDLPPDYSDIDESLGQAGLADVAESVMSTIKDILAEAEPLWAASKSNIAAGKATEAKVSGVAWDKARFEDLVRDLTSSVDTLYDISRARQGSQSASNRKRSVKNIELIVQEEREFQKSRIDTPQVMDPTLLRDSYGRSVVVRTEAQNERQVGIKVGRQILYIHRASSSSNPWKPSIGPTDFPVMVEFAAYDSIYSITGITPPMKRFEKLFAGLQRKSEGITRPDFGVLNLMGYFEDPEHARFGLIYELPSRFSGVQLPNPIMNLPYYARLADILSHRSLEPPLEIKYRLAYNLATSVFDLHSKGVVHGTLAACNVTFFEQVEKGAENVDWLAHVDVRRPYLTGYDLFPEPATKNSPETVESLDTKWYRHTLDPRLTPHTSLTTESRSLDLYSLAMLLLEIGLWTSSKDIRSGSLGVPLDVKRDVKAVYKQLAARCGSAYLKAVKACWHAIDEEMNAGARPDVTLQKVYGHVLNSLERCCAIEDDTSEDEGYTQQSAEAIVTRHLTKPTPLRKPDAGFAGRRLAQRTEMNTLTPQSSGVNQVLAEQFTTQIRQHESSLTPAASQEREMFSREIEKPKVKPLRFPSSKIAAEHLDHWHNTLMPDVNHALRGFYRKYGQQESVELSLESIGETPQLAKPTVLIVCTSVSKVKSILKRHLSYDSATYGLMVCRGKVVRSRRRPVKRSMMQGSGSDGFVLPRNPKYQAKPTNGASIGAFCEDQALPAVSFGGLVKVDNELLGLTVHHMFDVPSDDEEDDDFSIPTLNSSFSIPQSASDSHSFAFEPRDDLGYEISECESDTASIASSIESDFSDGPAEPGDIGGISQDCADGYLITQPAYDDVEEEFFRTSQNPDADYLKTFTIGKLHTSSGIRRRMCHRNLSHEIDWALFKFSLTRQPSANRVEGAAVGCLLDGFYPVASVPLEELPGLDVHGIGRTTGLCRGRILPQITSVKIKGRQTPSQSYVITGGLGVPGDSGAWIIANADGRACGHILAWSDKRQVAYFCPMDVMFDDIKETLGAKEVCFPADEQVSDLVKKPDAIETASKRDGIEVSEREVNARLKSSKEAVRRSMFDSSVLVEKSEGNVGELELVDGMEGMVITTGLMVQDT